MTNQNTDQNGSESSQDALTKEEIEEFIRQFEELEADFKEFGPRFDPLIERQLRELAGTHFARMQRTPEATLRYLTDPNPKLREAALQLAYGYWKITATLATAYEKMAISDPDSDVRETAIIALGTCYSRTKDPRIGHLLADIARNDRLPDSMRITAFTSLLRLHGNMDYGVDYGGKSPLVPVSLEEIDWVFVDHYYSGRGWDFDSPNSE